ncbi:hypothetical protein C8R46DRAFT_1240428 [Mycena filopes]|nr:hypothetical protein C8R46DRAFT_1240428 [Mycena filopes]
MQAVANLEGMCGTPVPHKNITLGVPHLKEIINAATNIKTLCPTTVYLKPDIWLLMHSSAFSACFRLVFQRRWSINAGGFEAEAAPSPLRLRGTKSRSKSKQISASPRRFASRGAPSFYHPTTNRGHLPPRRFALPWRSLVRATQPPTGSRSASIACPFALPRRSFVVLTELHFHALLVVPLLQRASFVVPPSHARAPFVVPGPLARPSPRPGLLCSSLTPSHATRASSPSSHAPRSSSPSAVVSRPRLLVVPAFPRDSTRTSSPPSHACARRPRGSALPPLLPPSLPFHARARRPRRPRSSSPAPALVLRLLCALLVPAVRAQALARLVRLSYPLTNPTSMARTSAPRRRPRRRPAPPRRGCGCFLPLVPNGSAAHRPIALHLENRGLYARDGVPGHLYCCASVCSAVYDAFVAGAISQSQFQRALRVKLGVAENVFVRREDYTVCDSNGQTHLWLFFVRTRQRYRIERLLHLEFLCRARRSLRLCSGCFKRHREYWRFIHVGSFQRIRARVLALLARVGEPGALIIRLKDYYCVS